MIDIEFYEYDEIKEAWKIYHDHLMTHSNNEEEWGKKRIDYLTNLLYQMSRILGYKHFDQVRLKKGAYSPKLYGETFMDTQEIRKLIMGVLSGDRSIKVELMPENKDENGKAHEMDSMNSLDIKKSDLN